MIKTVLSRLGTHKYGKFGESEGTAAEKKAQQKQNKAIKKITSRLKNRIPGARRVALLDIIDKDIATQNKAKAFEFLAIGMEDSDPELRKTAIQLLGRVVAIGYEKHLESDACGPCGLESAEIEARVTAARAMGRLICPSDVRALEMVAKKLTDPDAAVRECAMQVLCKVTTRAYAKASEIIAYGLRTADAEARRDCLNLLAVVCSRSNEGHLTALAHASRDDDAIVRLAAQSAKLKVERRGHESALELFMEHSLEHADAAVRRAGVEVIRRTAMNGKEEAFEFFTGRPCAPPAGYRTRAASCNSTLSAKAAEHTEKLPCPCRSASCERRSASCERRSASCERRDGREGSGRPMRNVCHGGA
jgi:hypothetical protein